MLRSLLRHVSLGAVAAALLATSAAAAGPDNGPADPFLAKVEAASGREPAVRRPAQEAQARAKLEALQRRSGQRPNIVVVLMDDVGWGDFGSYGGGAAVGAATPNLDRLAQGGLRLTSAYSQPSCTPREPRC